MSHYPLEELIERWKREEMTVEQMIGQMLLVLREQEQRLRYLKQVNIPPAETISKRASSHR